MEGPGSADKTPEKMYSRNMLLDVFSVFIFLTCSEIYHSFLMAVMKFLVIIIIVEKINWYSA